MMATPICNSLVAVIRAPSSTDQGHGNKVDARCVHHSHNNPLYANGSCSICCAVVLRCIQPMEGQMRIGQLKLQKNAHSTAVQCVSENNLY